MLSSPLPATDKATVGNRLRLIREVLGLSRKDVCDRWGYGETAWDNYENGIRGFDHEIAIRFVEGAKVSFDWLYRGNMDLLPNHIAEKLRIALADAHTEKRA